MNWKYCKLTGDGLNSYSSNRQKNKQKMLRQKSIFTLSNNLKLLIFVQYQSATTIMIGGKKIIIPSNTKEEQQCWLLEFQRGSDLVWEFPFMRIVASNFKH